MTLSFKESVACDTTTIMTDGCDAVNRCDAPERCIHCLSHPIMSSTMTNENAGDEGNTNIIPRVQREKSFHGFENRLWIFLDFFRLPQSPFEFFVSVDLRYALNCFTLLSLHEV